MNELLVWFIRHAESESNAGLPMEDTRLVGLSPKGIEQARRFANVFSEPPSLIVTSPYYRSHASARPTIERFPTVPQEQWPVQEFFYLAHFRGQLSTRQERKEAAGAYWQRCDPFFRVSEGAETFAELIERVRSTLERLRQQEQGFVAIFGHGHFMRVMYWTLFTGSFEVSAERMHQFRAISRQFTVPNTAIIKLRFDPQGLWFSQIITAHLVESAAPPQPGVDILEAE
jgi:2,3-bisphosphoglycerate-dependent phosphoglycerate mutase